MDKKITFIFKHPNSTSYDVEVDIDITARELLIGLNEVFDLNCDFSNFDECFLIAENPFALLRGSKTLREYGLVNASVITYRPPKKEARGVKYG